MSHDSVMDIVMPEGSDYLAMGVAFVAYFFVSFLWWGPIFGRKWGTLMGMEMDPNNRPSMAMPMVLQAVGTLLLSYVLWNVMAAFATTHDGTELVIGKLGMGSALLGAFFTWLGFFVPVQLGRVAWEKATWSLFAINAGGHLVALMVMAVVFVLMPGSL